MRRIFVLGPVQKRKRKISNAWSINLSSYSTWFQIRFGKKWARGSCYIQHYAKKRAVIAIYDSTVQKISLAHCSEIKMNCKRLSRFQFQLPGLLGTSLMSNRIKRLICNRRELSSSLLHPNHADAHTQHKKNVDQHQNGKMKEIIFHEQCISQRL